MGHAIVTGGAGHLGAATAHALRQRGHTVFVIDRPGEALQRIGNEAGIVPIACDLLDPEAASAAFSTAWGMAGAAIPILVNAVGRIHSAPLVNLLAAENRKHDAAIWRDVVDANLTATFISTAEQVDRMVATRTRGVVVNFGSIAASGNAGQAAYSAAKAGIVAATVAWGKELGPFGIRFVAIAPGFIDTPTTHDALSEAALKDWQRRTPLRRLGTATEVADAVLFAVNNAHFSGRVIELDGGLTL
ncbi:MAG TPA: SDR family oxidoreductase [Acetobacteraceae bacterium]|nr:SDR family oxidoreductase [Acetobacteraceae bacterium]